MCDCLFPHLRNPILEPGRGIPAEGANGGAAEPARQWYRDAVLHLPDLLQRPCARSRGTQGLHQQDCVGLHWAPQGPLVRSQQYEAFGGGNVALTVGRGLVFFFFSLQGEGGGPPHWRREDPGFGSMHGVTSHACLSRAFWFVCFFRGVRLPDMIVNIVSFSQYQKHCDNWGAITLSLAASEWLSE